MSVGNESSNTTDGHERACDVPLHTENLFMTIFLIIVMLLCIFGNLLVIAVVFVYERLHQVTNYFIVSLAVADLLLATLSMPFSIHQTMHNSIWCLNMATCRLYLVVDVICSSASITSLAAISIDRLVAINSPFRYSQLITKKTTFMSLFIAWSYSFLWGFLVLTNWTNPGETHFTITRNGNASQCFKDDPIFYTCATVLAFFLPLFIIITAYSTILKIAITQAKAVAALDPSRDRRRRTSFFREVKATKTIALVIGAFVVSWLPVFTILLVSLWDSDHVNNFAEQNPELYKAIYYIFVKILPPLNSCMNPIIYAVFNSNFRSAFIKFLHLPRRMRGNQDNSMVGSSTRSPERTTYSTMMADKSS